MKKSLSNRNGEAQGFPLGKAPAKKDTLATAQHYCDQGWLNEALEMYAMIVKENPDDAVALLEYGNTLFKKGDIKASLAVYSQITQFHPERIDGWNNRGIAEVTLGDTMKAKESFLKVLHREPQNTGALINLGNCYAAAGNHKEACSCFEQACSICADLPDGWYNLGNALIALEKFDDARRAFEKALRYRMDFPSALKNLGWIYEHDGLLDDAQRCYSEALLINKADPKLHVNLGNVYTRLRNYDDAKRSFLKAIRLAPQELQGWMGLRRYALAKGDIDTFVRSTLSVLGRLSDETLANSIEVLYGLDQTDKADLLLAHAERLGMKGTLVDVQRLLLYQRQGKKGDAVTTILQRLCSISEPPDQVCRGLARYYLAEQQYTEAVLWAGRVGKPDFLSLGILWRAMLAQGRVKEVLSQINGTLVEKRGNYDTYFLCATIAARRGNRKRAELFLIYALDNGFCNIKEIRANPVLAGIFESMTAKRSAEEVVADEDPKGNSTEKQRKVDI